MRIESYGPTLTDISTQFTPNNSAHAGKIQPETQTPAAGDKTTLSFAAAPTALSAHITPAAQATPSPGDGGAVDKTTLSSTPAAAQSLTQTALQTATVRAAKVEDLRQAVNSAQYHLDAAKIAEAISNGGF